MRRKRSVRGSRGSCTTTSASRLARADDRPQAVGPGRFRARAKRMAAEAMKRAEDIAKSVHDLSHRLHPARLRLIGLVEALDGLQPRAVHARHDHHFTHENVPPTLPPDLTLCLFRIVQEALQNALKHSKAQNVSVDLRGASGRNRPDDRRRWRGVRRRRGVGRGARVRQCRERVEASGERSRFWLQSWRRDQAWKCHGSYACFLACTTAEAVVGLDSPSCLVTQTLDG